MDKYPITKATLDENQWKQRIAFNKALKYQQNQIALIKQLSQIIEILTRVNTLPIQETLNKDVQHFFIQTLFPAVCSRIFSVTIDKDIDSKNIIQTIELLVTFYIKLLDSGIKYQNILNVFHDILFMNNSIYRHHSLEKQKYTPYNWKQKKATQDNVFLEEMKIGDEIDAIKYDEQSQKACWSRAKIKEIRQQSIIINFCGDKSVSQYQINKQSIEIAPISTKSTDYEWRMSLKNKSLVEFYQSKYYQWVRCQVCQQQVIEQQKLVRLLYKQNDQKAKNQRQIYHDSKQWINVTSPKLQQLDTTCFRYKKHKTFHAYKFFCNDDNDKLFQYINNQRIFVVRRDKFAYQLIYKIYQQFCNNKGLQNILKLFYQQCTFSQLQYLITIFKFISPELHLSYTKQIFPQLNKVILKHFSLKTKREVSELDSMKKCLSTIEMFQIRAFSNEQRQQFEIALKLKLSDLYFECDKEKAFKQIQQIIEKYQTFTPKIIDTIKQQIFKKMLINIDQKVLKKHRKLTDFIFEKNLKRGQIVYFLKIAKDCENKERAYIYQLISNQYRFLSIQDCHYIIDQLLITPVEILQYNGLNLVSILQNKWDYKTTEFFDFCWQSSMKQISLNLLYKIANILTCRYPYQKIPTQYIEQKLKLYLQKLSVQPRNLPAIILISILKKSNVGTNVRDQLKQSEINKIILNLLLTRDQSVDSSYTSITFLNLLKLCTQNLSNFYLELDILLKIIDIGQSSKYKSQKYIYKKWCVDMVKCDNVFSSEDRQKINEVFYLYDDRNKLQNMTQTHYQILVNYLGLKHIYNQQKFIIKQVLSTLKYIFYNSKNQVSNLAFKHFTQIYLSQEHTNQQRQLTLSQQLQNFFHYYKQLNINKINRSLRFIQLVINQSQRQGQIRIQSINKQSKKQFKTFQILNKDKKYIINICLNDAFINMKKNITSHMSNQIVWKQIRIFDQRKNKTANNKLIKNLFTQKKIRFQIYGSPKNQLIWQKEQMNSKAREIIKNIFNIYSINGLMSNQQTKNYLLNVKQGYSIQSKLFTLFQKNDDDRDCFINFKNFLHYYQKMSQEKIWSNFKYFRIRYDFKSLDDPNADLLQSTPLRQILSKNIPFVEALKCLLRDPKTSKISHKIYMQLSINQNLRQHVIQNFKQLKYDLLNPFQTLNYLHIYWNLLFSQNIDQKQTIWRQQFLTNNSCQKLLQFLFSVLNNKQDCNKKLMSQAKMKIIIQSLDIVTEFMVFAFQRQDNIIVDQLLSNKHSFTHIIQRFPDETDFLQVQNCLKQNKYLQNYQWKGQSPLKIIQILFNGIQKMLKYKTVKKEIIITKYLRLCVILMVRQQTCQPFIKKLFTLFFSQDIITLLEDYVLITIIVLFFSNKITQQSIIFNQLIKVLTPQYNNLYTKIKCLPIFDSFCSLLQKLINSNKVQYIQQSTLQTIFSNIFEFNDLKLIQISLKILTKYSMTEINTQTLQKILKCYFLQNIKDNNLQLKQNVIKFIYSLCSNENIKQQVVKTILQTMQKYEQSFQNRMQKYKEQKQLLKRTSMSSTKYIKTQKKFEKTLEYLYNDNNKVCSFYNHFMEYEFSKQIEKQLMNIAVKLTTSVWKSEQQGIKILEKVKNYFENKSLKQHMFFDVKLIISLFLNYLSPSIQQFFIKQIIQTIDKMIKKDSLTLSKSNQQDILITSFLDSLLNQFINITTKDIPFFKFWHLFYLSGTIQAKYLQNQNNIIKIIKFYYTKYKVVQQPKQGKYKLYERYPYKINKQSNYYGYYKLLKLFIQIVTNYLNQSTNISQEFIDTIFNIDFLQLSLYHLIDQKISQNLFKQLFKICSNNITLSEKLAFVFLKEIESQNKQIFKLVHEFLMIDDNLKKNKMKWIIGSPSINIKIDNKKLTINPENKKDFHVHNYLSTLTKSKSILEIMNKTKFVEKFTIQTLCCLLKVCKDKCYFNYILSLPPPNYIDKDFNHFIYNVFIKPHERKSKNQQFVTDFTQLNKNAVKLYRQCMLINHIKKDPGQKYMQPIQFKIINQQQFQGLNIQSISYQIILVGKQNKQIKQYKGIIVENKNDASYMFRWKQGFEFLQSKKTIYIQDDKISDVKPCENVVQIWNKIKIEEK